MSRMKEYHHDAIMYEYYKNVYEESDMPLWVIEQYGYPPSLSAVEYGVTEQEPYPSESDMLNAYEAMNNEKDVLDEEYRNLAVGERMLIDVSFDDDGTAYPHYITKE